MLDDHLLHTCTIEPPGSGLDVYGNRVESYGTPVTGVRCRLIESREFVERSETTEGYVRSQYMLLLRADAVIEERARVSLVTVEDGTTVSDTFRVTELLVRRGRSAHHKTAMLERIS